MRLLLLFVASALAVGAQPARTVPVGDALYDAVERMQRRGLLLELHPTAQPYTEAEVAAALDALPDSLAGVEAEWAGFLRRRLPTARPGPGEIAVRADISTTLHASTSARLDALRPLDAPRSIPLGDGALYTDADAHVAIGTDRLVAQLGVRHSLYYNDAPDGYDIVNRAMMRNEEGYFAYRSPLADVAVGRVGVQWGRAGRDALLLSSNPPPFDALHLRLGGSRVAVRGVLGQLDSALPDGTFSGTIGSRPGDRPSAEPRIDRYFAAHRFDWRPSRHVALTVMESAVYSGANADLSLAYLVPTHAFAFLIDNTPKNVENNGAVGAMLWAQWRRWTLHGEVFVDDFDVVSGTEPASAALTGSLTWAGLPRADAEIGLTAVTARAYASPQPEGTYVFALRGLGTEFNDFVHLRARSDVYALPGLTVSPQIHALWQGEQTPEAPYLLDNSVPAILTGDVRRTLRLAVEGRYDRDPRWWARADLGLNLGDDAADGFHAVVALGARLGTAGSVRADL